jgi:hypothetical protein
MVEAHLASCASCQEVLAVFARTEPSPEATPSLWHRWRLGWAVPIAAAATAAAIWVAIPEDRGADEFERSVAPAVSEAQPSPGAPAPVEAPAPALEKREAASRRDAPRSPLESRAEQEGFADSIDSARPRGANERDQDRKAEAAPQTVAAPQTATAAAPAQEEQARLRAAEAPAGLLRQAPATEAVSPDPLVRWRILPTRRLERSTNGGQTWEPVPFPQPIDLIAVRAPSATSAIVTAADGRQFRTEDQGKTWNPVQP